MPNPNTRALDRALERARQEFFDEWGPQPMDLSFPPMRESFAKYLAAQGVLVVSDAVLTDEACKAAWHVATSKDDDYEEGFVYGNNPNALREFLGRVAKGETT